MSTLLFVAVGNRFSRRLPDRLVATFGNSMPNQTGDWVKVEILVLMIDYQTDTALA